MPLMPGAEPFRAEGGSTGVLLCHGLSGSPASMRPWGVYLAAQGYTVDVPRLPGHGTTVAECNMTRWEDWASEVERALLRLSQRCERIFVGGLSMGGALTVHLAQEHPDLVSGLMLVNPALASRDLRARYLLPAMRALRVKEYPAISNDIAKEGMDEVAYDKTPIYAMWSFTRQWPHLVADLHQVHQPTIVFHAPNDNLLDGASMEALRGLIGANDFSYVELSDSYHVATLDHDAPKIFDRSVAFIERVSADLVEPEAAAG
jgi:carboxylesterase